jgi:MFS transporter, ACS family, tartrate transporter
MLVLYVVSYLDRINVSFAGLQMNNDLHFDDAVFGFGASIFFAGYSIFAVPSNLMVAKVGARRWIAAIMIIWGLITIAMTTVRTPNEFYALRLLLGVAEAGFFPGMIFYLTQWFPKKDQGTAVARFMTAIPVAGVVGALLAAKVLSMNVMGLPGWQLLFLVTGAPAVVLGGSVFFYLTDSPEKASWLRQDEREHLIVTLARERAESATAGKSSILDAFVHPGVWTLAVLYFTMNLGMYGFQLWLPQLIKSVGGESDSQTALLSVIPAIFQALGMVLIARSSDRSGERPWHLAAAAGLAAISLAAAGIVHNPWLSLIALSLAAFGLWGTVGPFWALKSEFLSPANAAAGIGLINSVGTTGGFAGPWMVGAVKTYTSNFSASLFAMAFVLLGGSVLAILIGMRLKAGKESSAKV